ncbi:MAG: sulfotransferase [Chloroflexota bacterium]
MKLTNFRPVFIIGAARSGTKLLRDTIARHPDIDKVPYDVNYIWRMGNQETAHDELTTHSVTSEVKAKIRHQLKKYHRGNAVLIEKTVSNCLRIPFVNAIYPNAHFIHLIRDGYDVIESSYRQWTASPDWRYILKKASTYPITIAPSYAFKYLMTIGNKMISTQGQPHSTWGPVYDGMQDDLTQLTLLEVCAMQWQKCVLHPFNTLKSIPSERVITVRYADFVQSPKQILGDITEFIGGDDSAYQQMDFSEIHPNNVGKGFKRFGPKEADVISKYVEFINQEIN